MSFGFYRSEILGALCSTLVIWILTGVLIYIAFFRIIDRTFELEPIPMLITASVAVVFNLIMFFILHSDVIINGIENKHGHSHSNSNIDHTDIESTSKEQTSKANEYLERFNFSNISVRSAVIHVVGDFIQSIGVLVASLVIYLKVNFYFNNL